jgi:phosphatidylinositol dimannoside acyltransferase
MWQRLRQEGWDVLELVLLPGLAALLPWRLCFAVFKRLARCDGLYRAPCAQALRVARQYGWAGQDEKHWLWVRRLVTLVDHADHYLGLARTDAWMQQHLHVQGQWPAAGRATLLSTFHWGAGYWGLRHAAAHGLRPHALVASLDVPVYAGRTVLTWYARARNRNVARTLGAENFDIARDLKKTIRALRARQPVLGVLDVPVEQAALGVKVPLLGRHITVAKGLLRMAVEEQVPMTYYITGLNMQTGERFLRIEQLEVCETLQAQADTMFAHLHALIQEEAPAWHFWGIADQLFER